MGGDSGSSLNVLYIMAALMGGLGLIMILSPGSVRERTLLSRLLFGLLGGLIRLLPEDWQTAACRFFGVLFVLGGVFIGIVTIFLSETVAREKFNNDVIEEITGIERSYEPVIFLGGASDILLYQENPDDEENGSEFLYEMDYSTEESPSEVAAKIVRKADEFFSTKPGWFPAGQNPAPASAAPPAATYTAPLSPEQAELASADALLNEAGKLWGAGDKQGSIRNAEKALAIKARILGQGHPKVIEIKTQITNAQMQAAF
ncbi:MAG TPA: hypothetical protein PLB62_03840 [Candidatus Sumerlaeota bacterium]|nr:hypothetical protein [Candidatus Sumerlaeota bacterium]